MVISLEVGLKLAVYQLYLLIPSGLFPFLSRVVSQIAPPFPLNHTQLLSVPLKFLCQFPTYLTHPPSHSNHSPPTVLYHPFTCVTPPPFLRSLSVLSSLSSRLLSTVTLLSFYIQQLQVIPFVNFSYFSIISQMGPLTPQVPPLGLWQHSKCMNGRHTGVVRMGRWIKYYQSHESIH